MFRLPNPPNWTTSCSRASGSPSAACQSFSHGRRPDEPNDGASPQADRNNRRPSRLLLRPTTTTTSNSSNPTLNLKLSILQTDLSRTQYLLRSILRQRLSKLTKHSMHYLLRISSASQQQTPADSQPNDQQQPEDSIPDLTAVQDPSPLSTQELGFLRAHQTLLAGHFGASFLGSFPAQLRRLDDNAGGVSMVQGPDAREVVLVRCLVERVGVVVPPGDGVEVETVGEEMRMGDVWVVRWEGVREAWERGEVEVL
ncbi:GINS DNA replication complex subunit Sld5 [Aspergillus nomiae NRRL 13137]|uniref:DNA replication complex GINS protein SLD5 n=1 Tax=Aspergillus nomiae NRRL (strain ATCC 15546 / NRRL 13137 / CBS 260.88 / M93) TaxID=1509407 RepID=A0A0L1IVI7_ASPN3|nr:GINS DNA replication complex subunit Sld5 [Aspergillus nomiae NRRL 13137]KNG83499.1 GINS DNA replication complex subunit Sld5 [Aspergillus nomiae NRRL 13137]